jgi:hypothetical protein
MSVRALSPTTSSVLPVTLTEADGSAWAAAGARAISPTATVVAAILFMQAATLSAHTEAKGGRG